jgi:hypothetical protein
MFLKLPIEIAKFGSDLNCEIQAEAVLPFLPYSWVFLFSTWVGGAWLISHVSVNSLLFMLFRFFLGQGLTK